ncbi:MAG: peptide chain release factor N(5)-glutamine methyltransferase [Ignavibacteria bacterium]|jgi:release factor glutamine methyltransferase
MSDKKNWNILELLKVTENLFKEKNIDNARLNAEMMLADTLNMKRIDLYLDFEKPLDEHELTQFRDKVRRRLNREPLQYILGYSEFYGLKFKVNQTVLIPRPETELIVEKCIELIGSSELPDVRIMEIGTGSGCISISIAKNSDCKINAIDIDEETLSAGKENSAVHGTEDKINFMKMNFIADLKDFKGYNIVISNPPYIPIDEYNSLPEEIRNFEPGQALTDGKDGLVFYRKMIDLLKNTKNPVKILLEIGDGKKQIVKELLDENGIKQYTFYKDLLNIDRVLYVDYTPTA